MTAPLGVVIVNYRGLDDTLECLESLLRSTIPLRVVVVDNASGDGSVAGIVAWAAGERQPPAPSPALAALSAPPLPKPITCARIDEAEAAAAPPRDGLVVIEAARNGGFAAGNNIGVRYLLRDPAIDLIWLLNPDTAVEPAAAAAIVARMAAAPAAGMCGAQVRYYHRPDRIQALNGHRFRPATGMSRGIGTEQLVGSRFEAAAVERDTDFVLGASLAVSRRFVETVGLMEESYFLYFEEIDWAWRARGRFHIAFAAGAVVYHKEGGSIGSASMRGQRSNLSDYYLLRSRLKLIAAHRPWLLPSHWAVAAAQIAMRVWRRQPAKALVLTRALLGLKVDAGAPSGSIRAAIPGE